MSAQVNKLNFYVHPILHVASFASRVYKRYCAFRLLRVVNLFILSFFPLLFSTNRKKYRQAFPNIEEVEPELNVFVGFFLAATA